VTHGIFRVWLFAGMCIYSMTYAYIQTDRQTRVMFSMSVWGLLRLAPIKFKLCTNY